MLHIKTNILLAGICIGGFLPASVVFGGAPSKNPPGAGDGDAIDARVDTLLHGEKFDDEKAAELLLHPALTKIQFVEIVRAAGGRGRVMETLSLFSSSPPLLNGKFDQVLEAVALHPDSEAAEYLASNRYLEDYQIAAMVKIAKDNPDSGLASKLAGNLSLSPDAVEELASKGLEDTGTKLAIALAGSSLLPDSLQERFFDKAAGAVNSNLAASFALNKSLSPAIKDKIGAAVIDFPETEMAKCFGLNSSLSSAQIKALCEVSVAAPNSLLAEGLGMNASLQADHYATLIPALQVDYTTKLAQSLAGNPNVTDEVFSLLLQETTANPAGSVAKVLAQTGSAASTPARVANLANLIITNPDVPYAAGITTNPTVPQDFFNALVQAAISAPRSELCRSFMEDIRQKRFKGNRSQKMKIIEVSLTYGGQ